MDTLKKNVSKARMTTTEQKSIEPFKIQGQEVI